jgi:hypothetical protein
MNETTTTTTATVEAPVKPVKVAPKPRVKTDKPVKAPKAPKKAAPPASKKDEPKARAKKDGLRKPQIRVLQFLAKSQSKTGIDVNTIAEKAPVDKAWVSDAVFGRHDPVKRKEVEAAGYPSLLTLKLVEELRIEAGEINEWRYKITEKGRKALADLK